MVAHLNKTIPNFRMNAEVLETRPVAEILLNIVLEWSKIKKVTVREFSEVSKQLGIGRVEHILCEKEKDTPEVEFISSDELHVKG